MIRHDATKLKVMTTTVSGLINQIAPDVKTTTDWNEVIDDIEKAGHEANLDTWITEFKSQQINDSFDDVVEEFPFCSPGYGAFCASSGKLVKTLQDFEQVNVDCTEETIVDANLFSVTRNDGDTGFSPSLPQSPCCSVQDNEPQQFRIVADDPCSARVEEESSDMRCDVNNSSFSHSRCFDTSLLGEIVEDVISPGYSIDLCNHRCLEDNEDHSAKLENSLPYFDEQKNRKRRSQLSRRKAAFEEKQKWKLYLRAITRIQSHFKKTNARKRALEQCVTIIKDMLVLSVCKSAFFAWLTYMDTDIKQSVMRRLGLFLRRGTNRVLQKSWHVWKYAIQLKKAIEVFELLAKTLTAATIRWTCVQWKYFVEFEQKMDSVNLISTHVNRNICKGYLKLWKVRNVRVRQELALMLIVKVLKQRLFQTQAKWFLYVLHHREAMAAQAIQKFFRGYNTRASIRRMVSLNFEYLDAELDDMFCGFDEEDISFLSKVDESNPSELHFGDVWQPRHPLHDSMGIGISSLAKGALHIIPAEPVSSISASPLQGCDDGSKGFFSYSPRKIDLSSTEKEVGENDWSEGVTKAFLKRRQKLSRPTKQKAKILSEKLSSRNDVSARPQRAHRFVKLMGRRTNCMS